MKETDLWVKKLKEKLEDYSEPLPVSGWEQLEKELVPPIGRKIYLYRRRMLAVAAVILLAVLSSVSLYLLRISAPDEILRTSAPELISKPVDVPGMNLPEEKPVAVEPLVRPVPVVRKDRLARVEKKDLAAKPISGEEEETGKGEKEKGEESLPVADSGQERKQETGSGNQTPTRRVRPSSKDKLHVPSKKMSKTNKGWALGLAVGNSVGASAGVGDGAPAYMTRVNTVTLSDELMEVPSDKKLVFDDGIPYLRQSKVVTDMKHRQPVSVGISVRKNLGSGFSVETGLNYTFLSSEAKLAGSEEKLQQKLHYLGIPLRGNWNFLDKERFTLYVSGGGMVEKCVYGKLGNEKETVDPLQFSVSGAVGAQLNATKRLGFYVEPGVSYFFNDGSEIQTIRKENPFNFTVRAGIRLTY